MNKRILITGLVLLATFCLAASLFAAVGGIAFLRRGGLLDQSGLQQALPTLAAELSTGTPAPESTPSVTRTPQAGQQQPNEAPSAELPQDVQQQMDLIQQQVSQIRGLSMDQPLNRDVLTTAQLREHVVNNMLKEYTPEDIQHDQMLLSAMGLLEPGFDLKGMYTELLTEQIAGFYDDETQSMYVVQGESFQGFEHMTYAHEFTHALQDAAFRLRDGMQVNETYCKDHSEYCAAAQALIEGDASLTEQLWLYNAATQEERSQVQAFYKDYQSPVFDAAPEFMRQDLQFPYLKGVDFVQRLYEQGGFDAVDEAFRNPPQSTEQIMHPERYPNDKPVTVSLPDLSTTFGSGWSQVDQNVLGEWDTYLVLTAGNDAKIRMDEANAAKAAEGWGGDEYAVYQNEAGQVALVLRTAWDTAADANEFANLFSRYGRQRWGQPASSGDQFTWENTTDGFVTFRQDGQDTLWVMAPNADLADQLVAAVNGS